MDNQELLSQVLTAMQEQTEVLTQMVDRKVSEVRQEIKDSETRINIKIENDVTNRINALFDGYKLTHEKQWELEKRVEAIERKLGIAG